MQHHPIVPYSIYKFNPLLVVALEKVERSSGTLIGSSIATIQKSAAPEMLLALIDEAYTGSAIDDPSGNSGSDDSGPLDLADPVFLDLLKDENDGIAAKHWTSPTISSTLQAAVNSPQSDRLKTITGNGTSVSYFVFRNSILGC